MSEQQRVLFPQHWEPYPTLPFRNTPPCQSSGGCCSRQSLGLWCCCGFGPPSPLNINTWYEKKIGAFGAGQFSLGTLVGGRPGTAIFQNPGGGGDRIQGPGPPPPPPWPSRRSSSGGLAREHPAAGQSAAGHVQHPPVRLPVRPKGPLPAPASDPPRAPHPVTGPGTSGVLCRAGAAIRPLCAPRAPLCHTR